MDEILKCNHNWYYSRPRNVWQGSSASSSGKQWCSWQVVFHISDSGLDFFPLFAHNCTTGIWRGEISTLYVPFPGCLWLIKSYKTGTVFLLDVQKWGQLGSFCTCLEMSGGCLEAQVTTEKPIHLINRSGARHGGKINEGDKLLILKWLTIKWKRQNTPVTNTSQMQHGTRLEG